MNENNAIIFENKKIIEDYKLNEEKLKCKINELENNNIKENENDDHNLNKIKFLENYIKNFIKENNATLFENKKIIEGNKLNEEKLKTKLIDYDKIILKYKFDKEACINKINEFENILIKKDEK